MSTPALTKIGDEDFSREFFRNTMFLYSKEKNSINNYGQLIIEGKERKSIYGNIFVFIVKKEFASHFIMITSTGYGGHQLDHAFIYNSNNPCYFRSISGKKAMKMGFVFIDAELPHSELKSCIHEELFQVMGLFNDYPGSKIFNFDNKSEQKEIYYDELLLRSLYSPDIDFGGDIEKVLDKLRTMLRR